MKGGSMLCADVNLNWFRCQIQIKVQIQIQKQILDHHERRLNAVRWCEFKLIPLPMTGDIDCCRGCSGWAYFSQLRVFLFFAFFFSMIWITFYTSTVSGDIELLSELPWMSPSFSIVQTSSAQSTGLFVIHERSTASLVWVSTYLLPLRFGKSVWRVIKWWFLYVQIILNVFFFWSNLFWLVYESFGQI